MSIPDVPYFPELGPTVNFLEVRLASDEPGGYYTEPVHVAFTGIPDASGNISVPNSFLSEVLGRLGENDQVVVPNVDAMVSRDLGLIAEALPDEFFKPEQFRLVNGTALDLHAGTAEVQGEIRQLTPNVGVLLGALAEDPGYFIPKDVLKDAVWPGERTNPYGVDTHSQLYEVVLRARRQLGRNSIISEHGGGYLLNVQPELATDPELPQPPTPQI